MTGYSGCTILYGWRAIGGRGLEEEIIIRIFRLFQLIYNPQVDTRSVLPLEEMIMTAMFLLIFSIYR